ncbi:hypothetical protein CIB48_g1319 [Xylaria polymorpha]|nr:hypothetical protein CIB48_g1319 [Xylaria polymorpha]
MTVAARVMSGWMLDANGRNAALTATKEVSQIEHHVRINPSWDMQRRPRGKEFKEVGMAIGITRNAQAALDLIGPSAEELLKRTRAVPMCADDGKRLRGIVHRVEYLRELSADVPPQERMHITSKKLETVDYSSDGSVTLHFTDGTTHQCDMLIRADGIRSTVANSFSVKTTLRFHPGIRAKGLVDVGDAREYSWAGDNTYMLHNLLSDDQLVQVVIVSSDKVKETESSEQWSRTVTADEMQNLFRGWTPHLTQAIDEQASGGGTSIEDSLILSTLLGRARSPSEAHADLKAYDQVRRPRTQCIVDSSRETGKYHAWKRREDGR